MEIENKDLYGQIDPQTAQQGETPTKEKQNQTESPEITTPKKENEETNGEINQKKQEEQERKRQEELRKQEEIRRQQVERYRKAKEAFPTLAKTPNLNPQIVETLIKFSEKFISKEQKQLSIKDAALFSIRKLQKNAGNMAFDENNPQYKIVKEKIQLLFNKTTSSQKIISAINEIQDIMKYANYEKKRWDLNVRRIAPKMEKLSKIIGKNNMGEAQQISDQYGNLTFEVFLDDILYKRFPIPNTTNITELYSAWEYYYIIKLSNKTPERYKRAIETTTENNQRFKNQALAKVKDPSNLREIKIANEESNRKAKEVNGLLNRQELIIAALNSPKTEQDLIKIIQIIGQVYYNNKEIFLNGNRWRQTQSIVEKLIDEFENNEKFKKHNCIQKLKTLKQKKKKYDTRNTKARLDRYMQASIFDTQKTTAYYKAHPEENPLLKNTNNSVKSAGSEYKKSQQEQEQQATAELTKDSFDHIDDDMIDNMIPEDQLTKSAWAFVNRLIKQGAIKIENKQEKNSDSESSSEEENQDSLSFPTKESAIKTVLSWEISTKELEALNKARESSPEKAQVFTAQKELLTQTLKISAKETVVRAGTDFLRKMGVQLEGSQKLITLNNWVYYYEFSSIDGIKYYYRPDTWNISTPNLNSIDHNQKELKLWFQGKYTILHHIPSYAQLTEQAQNLSFLNTEKPRSNEELSKIIKNGMQSNIDLSVWELETDAVKEIIQKENTKTKIAQDIINTFNSDQNLNLKQEENPVLYQTLQPLLNTLNTPRLSSSQVQNLQKFTQILRDKAKFSRDTPQNIKAHPENMTSLDQLKINSPQDLFTLITNQLELKKLKNPSERKKDEKAEFWLSILLKFFEKSLEGKGSDFKILDLQKIEPLINNFNDPNFFQKPGYQNLHKQIKNLYPKKIENQRRKLDEENANKILKEIENS